MASKIKKIGKTTINTGRRGKWFGGSISRGRYQVGLSNNPRGFEVYAGKNVEKPTEKSIGIKIPRKRKTKSSW